MVGYYLGPYRVLYVYWVCVSSISSARWCFLECSCLLLCLVVYRPPHISQWCLAFLRSLIDSLFLSQYVWFNSFKCSLWLSRYCLIYSRRSLTLVSDILKYISQYLFKPLFSRCMWWEIQGRYIRVMVLDQWFCICGKVGLPGWIAG